MQQQEPQVHSAAGGAEERAQEGQHGLLRACEDRRRQSRQLAAEVGKAERRAVRQDLRTGFYATPQFQMFPTKSITSLVDWIN